MIIVKDQWTAIVAILLECLQIPLRRIITCVMTRQRQEKLASLILVHKAHAGSK